MTFIMPGADIRNIRHNATLKTPLNLIIPRLDLFYDGETAHGYHNGVFKCKDRMQVDVNSSKIHLFLYDFMQWDIQLISPTSPSYQTILYKSETI